MQAKTKPANREILLAAAFLVLVPTLAQLLFSWRGFTPTDDGFTLAYSRRILEGEIPHLDFIIIRPFLSPLIHTPFVLFGGEYTYWLSRFFVWFQFACIGWAWTSIINRAFGNPFGSATKTLLALVAFAACAHQFVLTAWHTIDGLFLASIGLWLISVRPHANGRLAGYALIGAAYLCKQSFIFMAPLCVLLLGDWRNLRAWVSTAVPGLLYCAWLLASGSFPDAFAQLTSQTGIVSTGIISYLSYAVPVGVVAGFGLMLLLNSSATPLLSSHPARYTGALALISMPALFIAFGLFRGSIAVISFGVFGMALGALAFCIVSQAARDTNKMRVVAVALVFAWSASLSFGYNAPALFLGPLFVALVAFVYTARETLAPRVLQTALVVLGAVILVGFGDSRINHIYREQPSGELTKSLDGVLPGGKLLYTNPRTYSYMKDLRDATERVSARGKDYAVIPESAGWWVQADQANPLPIDWPWAVELGSQQLTDRVTNDLATERGATVVIVQKAEAFQLAKGFVPLDESQYPVVEYVKDNYRKTGETKFFEIYE